MRMMKLAAVGLLSLGLVGLSPMSTYASGTTLYVSEYFGGDTIYNSATLSYDDNPCTSSTTPCATIGHALAHAGAGDTIHIAAGNYPESLDIEENLTLVGAGVGQTVVGGSVATGASVVSIGDYSTPTVSISGVTISGLSAFLSGIFINQGTLTLAQSTVSGNGEGGIQNHQGTLTVTNSTVSGNDDSGITIFGGTVTVNSSTVSGNLGVTGGGIENVLGTVTLNGSTVSGNTGADEGGGIHNSATLILNNSTVSGNRTDGYGGGISNALGTVTLAHSTVTNNSAAAGAGGIYLHSGSASLTQGTKVTNNTPDNCEPALSIKGCKG
jgi:hypothetical protein